MAVAALLGGALLEPARLRWDAPALLLLGLFVAGLASATLSPHSASILRNNLDLLRTLATYWVFLNLVRTERQAYLVVELLLASAVAAFLLSVNQLNGFKGVAIASLGYCNNVGMYYSMIAALALSLSLCAKASRPRQAWWALALGTSLAAMAVAALCRSALLGFGVFAALALLVSGTRQRRRYSALLLAALVCLVAVAAGDLTELKDLGFEFGSLAERWRIWRLAGSLFLEHPLLGVGPGNFMSAVRALLADNVGGFYYLGNAHSLYLNTLAERGLIGLILLLAFFGAAIHRLRRAASTLATPQATALWLAGLGAVLIVLIIGLLDHPLHHEHALLMATLLALPLAQEPRGHRLVG